MLLATNFATVSQIDNHCQIPCCSGVASSKI